MNLLNILKSILLYGFIAILAKSFQFFTIIYLEYELLEVNFVDYGLKYALQTGIVVFTVFGVNEGMISRYVKVTDKNLLLNNSMKIVLTGQLSILIFSIFYFGFFSFSDYIFPTINGVILGNLLMTSCIYKLNEKHSKARFYLYVPQIVFHTVILICVYSQIKIDPFLLSTIALIIFLILFQTKTNLLSFKSKISYNTFKDLIFESSSYYSMAILGWFSGYGFSWVIKYLFNDTDVAQYIYIYTFSGIILLFTNSIFNVWNPYYLNSKQNISIKTQDLVYDLVSIGITLISILTALCLYFLKKDFEHQLINLAILLSSFIFYIPIWRARLYFQKLKKGWVLMRLTFISSITSYILFLSVQDFLGPISVYLFFVFNAITLCLFTVREFSKIDHYQIKYKNQYLLGITSIVFIYLLQINLLFTIFGIIVLLLLSYYKLNKLRRLW